MDFSKRSEYNMAVWLPLLLIAFSAIGIFHFKARAAKLRRTENAFEEQRNLATERLERAIVESGTIPAGCSVARYAGCSSIWA